MLSGRYIRLLVATIVVVHAGATLSVNAAELQWRGESPTSTALAAPSNISTPALRGGRARDTDHLSPLALLGSRDTCLEPPTFAANAPSSAGPAPAQAPTRSPLKSRAPPRF